MRKQFQKIWALLIISCLLAVSVPAQQQVGIPVKKLDAFVLEFKAPYDTLLVDIGENAFSKSETTSVVIASNARFTLKKNKSFDKALLRPGMKIEISGERFGNQINATEIRLNTDLEKWEVEIKGYFESLDGDRAWIDGKTVKLSPGVIIRGEKEWTGKTFSSFSQMMLGSHVSVKGVRRPDGIVYAESGQTKPNLYTDTDKQLIIAVQKNIVAPNGLAGGKGKVLGREVKFADSLELQTYVTRVGYKLIPRYQKEMSKDDPAKITYRFAVIEDESFNAFALPDGSVFIHTGLLKELKNEAQLAAVLGHEIAHVTHEHSRKRMADAEKKAWIALALGVAGAATKTNAVALAGNIGLQIMSNNFGREQEDQADRVGLYYMAQAGYDPREAPKVWRERLKFVKEDAVSNFIYSDHSSAFARLKHLNRELAFSYYETDFKNVIVGEDSYRNTVGVYFGWIPKPQPVTALPHTAKPAGKTSPVKSKSRTNRPKIRSGKKP
ncbi:MAG: M48 family metallopeptidase [Acidobacteriota bacterium]|nr:M48 family metallopeptidase [Acidobacteriota bacterium]